MPTATKAPAAGKATNGTGDKVSAREAARKQKEEAQAKARKAKIDSGDLVVTRTHEFETTDRSPASTKVLSKIIETYKRSSEPLVFNEVAKKAGAKYPEDVITAMYALENLGLVKRFLAKPAKGTVRRPQVAFQWVTS